jgi:hypothetical protein
MKPTLNTITVTVLDIFMKHNLKAWMKFPAIFHNKYFPVLIKEQNWELRTALVRSLVFWDVAPCSHVEVDRRLRGVYGLDNQGFIALMIEAVRTSETSVHFNVTTWRYIPENSELHICRREDLKCHCITVSLNLSQSHAWQDCTVRERHNDTTFNILRIDLYRAVQFQTILP